MKRTLIAIPVAACWAWTAPSIGAAAQEKPSTRTLFTHVHVFDGTHEERIMNANVLVEGNLIKQVSASPIDAAGATVIDAGGRTLMPGAGRPRHARRDDGG